MEAAAEETSGGGGMDAEENLAPWGAGTVLLILLCLVWTEECESSVAALEALDLFLCPHFSTTSPPPPPPSPPLGLVLLLVVLMLGLWLVSVFWGEPKRDILVLLIGVYYLRFCKEEHKNLKNLCFQNHHHINTFSFPTCLHVPTMMLHFMPIFHSLNSNPWLKKKQLKKIHLYINISSIIPHHWLFD